MLQTWLQFNGRQMIFVCYDERHTTRYWCCKYILKGSIMEYFLTTKNTLLGYLKEAKQAAEKGDLDHFRELGALGLCDYIGRLSGSKISSLSFMFDKVLGDYAVEKGVTWGFPVEGGFKAYYGYPEGLSHISDYYWDVRTPYGKARLEFLIDFIDFVENNVVAETEL